MPGAPQLPPQLGQFLGSADDDAFLDRLALAALDSRWTEAVFVSYENAFVDLCGRFLASLQSGSVDNLTVLSAMARVLPHAPHLAEFADAVLNQTHALAISSRDRAENPRGALLSSDSFDLTTLPEAKLVELLLATYRLLSFDNAAYAHTVSPSKLPGLLQHASRPVRYLTICILRLYLHAADYFMQTMVQRYLGSQPVEGHWEGKTIDYVFLTLWEEKRFNDTRCRLDPERATGSFHADGVKPQYSLSPLTADVCGRYLPRLRGPPASASTLVPTPTTVKNMRALADALLANLPILITGLAGCGKTTLITDVARELGADASMLTLHLNEQTDAKLLVGMYTTGATPGSFAWRAGVLTTAVREGRWVLIEGIDRAPTEVLSIILPLLERRELLIPSQGEVVRAARTFRLIATMRTSLNNNGEELQPAVNMLGASLWTRLRLSTPSLDEYAQIILGRYSLLRAYLPIIMSVYGRVNSLYCESSFAARSQSSLARPVTPRDLLKWCRRIDCRLRMASARTGSEAVTETMQDDIFMEAVDCLAGSLHTDDARASIVKSIGEGMQLAPARVEHLMHARIPRLSLDDETVRVGRATLIKRATARSSRRRTTAGQRPFATTPHTLRLLEQVGAAVREAEPVLLVGETGTGKTTVVQHLATCMGQNLIVVNLSQQSEGGDLLGGFKPVDARTLAMPMKDEFDDLFDLTFSAKKNQRYLDMLSKCVVKGQWVRAVTLWKEALEMVDTLLTPMPPAVPPATEGAASQASKRRKVASKKLDGLRPRWLRFEEAVKSLDTQLAAGSKNFAFKFVEGNIVKAARNGEWVLLDEINLASPETLESIADLITSGSDGAPSILLSESGDIERVRAHPDFRIFGAMNPATDVGKKDLPSGLRSGFTEFFVQSPDRDLGNLQRVVEVYLGGMAQGDVRAV